MKKTGFKTQFIWNITWVFLQVAFYKQVIRVASFQFFSRWLRIYIFSKTKQNNYRRVHHRRGMTVKQIYLLGQNPLESNMHSLQTCLPPWYLTGKKKQKTQEEVVKWLQKRIIQKCILDKNISMNLNDNEIWISIFFLLAQVNDSPRLKYWQIKREQRNAAIRFRGSFSPSISCT